MKKFTILCFLILAPIFAFAKESSPSNFSCPDCSVIYGNFVLLKAAGMVDGPNGYYYVVTTDDVKIEIPWSASRLANIAVALKLRIYIDSSHPMMVYITNT